MVRTARRRRDGGARRRARARGSRASSRRATSRAACAPARRRRARGTLREQLDEVSSPSRRTWRRSARRCSSWVPELRELDALARDARAVPSLRRRSPPAAGRRRRRRSDRVKTAVAAALKAEAASHRRASPSSPSSAARASSPSRSPCAPRWARPTAPRVGARRRARRLLPKLGRRAALRGDRSRCGRCQGARRRAGEVLVDHPAGSTTGGAARGGVLDDGWEIDDEVRPKRRDFARQAVARLNWNTCITTAATRVRRSRARRTASCGETRRRRWRYSMGVAGVSFGDGEREEVPRRFPGERRISARA